MNDIITDGIFVDYNTPLDLSYTQTYNMSITCEKFIEKNKWNKYFYTELNKYTPCLDQGYYINGKFVDSLSLHNIYGHMHMKRVLINYLAYFNLILF